MENFLSNSWVVGIGVTVIGGLILHYVFGIGKNKTKNKPERIGILNHGKKNKFVDNIISGFDIGIQDEGENTIAKGNKFK